MISDSEKAGSEPGFSHLEMTAVVLLHEVI